MQSDIVLLATTSLSATDTHVVAKGGRGPWYLSGMDVLPASIRLIGRLVLNDFRRVMSGCPWLRREVTPALAEGRLRNDAHKRKPVDHWLGGLPDR